MRGTRWFLGMVLFFKPYYVDASNQHADVNAYDNRGDTPLARAVLQRREKCLQQLLAHQDIQVDRRVAHCTPLFIAAAEGYYRGVELLLAHGANPDACNQRGTSPLLAAIKRDYYQLVPLLLENGADTRIGDKRRVTPLELVLLRYRRHSGFWYSIFCCFERARKVAPFMQTAELLMLYGARVVPWHWKSELMDIFPDDLVRAIITNSIEREDLELFIHGRYAYARAFLYALKHASARVVNWLFPYVHPYAPIRVGIATYAPCSFMRWLRIRYPRSEYTMLEHRWYHGALLRLSMLRKTLHQLPDDVLWLILQRLYGCDDQFIARVQEGDSAPG